MDSLMSARSENNRMIVAILEQISYILFMRRREYIHKHHNGISREKAIELLSQPVDVDNVSKDFVVTKIVRTVINVVMVH